MAALLLLLALTLATITHQADSFMTQDESPNQVLRFIQDKRASNLGGRLMCQLDSRNCAAFNVGKKFVGYSWLRGGDIRQRRDYYYYKNLPAQHTKYEMYRGSPRAAFNLKY